MASTAGRLLLLSNAVLEKLLSCCEGLGIRLTNVASSCKRLNVLCRRAFAQQLKLQDSDAACYNAAIAHAARDMPCISALEMQCNRLSPTDEAPAQLLLSCKQLTALRSLTLSISTSNRSTFTALDASALAELTALTALQLSMLQDAAGRRQQQQTPSVAELSPLTRLTALQHLSIQGWPLGKTEEELPAAVPAAASACCLPVHLTSLQLLHVRSGAIVMWLPSVLACTGLQDLQLHVTELEDDGHVNVIMSATVQYLTGLTALQMQSDAGGDRWNPHGQVAQHIGQLQQLQHLQLYTCSKHIAWDSGTGIHPLAPTSLFRCSALCSLGELYVGRDQIAPVPDGVVLPHLTHLRLHQKVADTRWPAAAFPNLQSLHLITPATSSPHQQDCIPGSSSITQLTLWAYPQYFVGMQPEAAQMQAMAAALPQLRALHFILPSEAESIFNAEDQRSCFQAWLHALAGFTQVEQLTLLVPKCFIALHNLQPAPPATEDLLRALCKLQQLQQLTLQGWVWDVSPLLLVGLEVGLPQLSSIRLEGRVGCGQELAPKKAELQASMRRVAAGMRPGLQLEYVE